jgi:hypothetical protein
MLLRVAEIRIERCSKLYNVICKVICKKGCRTDEDNDLTHALARELLQPSSGGSVQPACPFDNISDGALSDR